VMINSVTIGRGATVAAGSVVTKDIGEGLLVFGSPATSKRSVRIRSKKFLKRHAKRILTRLGLLDALRQRMGRG
jgi:serine acetyltransferase